MPEHNREQFLKDIFADIADVAKRRKSQQEPDLIPEPALAINSTEITDTKEPGQEVINQADENLEREKNEQQIFENCKQLIEDAHNEMVILGSRINVCIQRAEKIVGTKEDAQIFESYLASIDNLCDSIILVEDTVFEKVKFYLESLPNDLKSEVYNLGNDKIGEEKVKIIESVKQSLIGIRIKAEQIQKEAKQAAKDETVEPKPNEQLPTENLDTVVEPVDLETARKNYLDAKKHLDNISQIKSLLPLGVSREKVIAEMEKARDIYESARAEFVGSHVGNFLDERSKLVEMQLANYSKSRVTKALDWYRKLGDRNLLNYYERKHGKVENRLGRMALKSVNVRTGIMLSLGGIGFAAGGVASVVGLSTLLMRRGSSAALSGSMFYELANMARSGISRSGIEKTLQQPNININDLGIYLAKLETAAMLNGKTYQDLQNDNLYQELFKRYELQVNNGVVLETNPNFFLDKTLSSSDELLTEEIKSERIKRIVTAIASAGSGLIVGSGYLQSKLFKGLSNLWHHSSPVPLEQPVSPDTFENPGPKITIAKPEITENISGKSLDIPVTSKGLENDILNLKQQDGERYDAMMKWLHQQDPKAPKDMSDSGIIHRFITRQPDFQKLSNLSKGSNFSVESDGSIKLETSKLKFYEYNFPEKSGELTGNEDLTPPQLEVPVPKRSGDFENLLNDQSNEMNKVTNSVYETGKIPTDSEQFKLATEGLENPAEQIDTASQNIINDFENLSRDYVNRYGQIAYENVMRYGIAHPDKGFGVDPIQDLADAKLTLGQVQTSSIISKARAEYLHKELDLERYRLRNSKPGFDIKEKEFKPFRESLEEAQRKYEKILNLVHKNKDYEVYLEHLSKEPASIASRIDINLNTTEALKDIWGLERYNSYLENWHLTPEKLDGPVLKMNLNEFLNKANTLPNKEWVSLGKYLTRLLKENEGVLSGNLNTQTISAKEFLIKWVPKLEQK